MPVPIVLAGGSVFSHAGNIVPGEKRGDLFVILVDPLKQPLDADRPDGGDLWCACSLSLRHCRALAFLRRGSRLSTMEMTAVETKGQTPIDRLNNLS